MKKSKHIEPQKRINWSVPHRTKLFANKAYGGILRRSRRGRKGPRFVTSRNSMHIVLRSSRANGEWSFTRKENKSKIQKIIENFSAKYAVHVHSYGIVDDHIHLHVSLTDKELYKAFIRAITSSIAMAISKVSRWNKNALNPSRWDEIQRKAFWDHRPFTRIVYGAYQFLTLKKYIEINQIEGLGFSKKTARWIFKNKLEWAQLRLKNELVC